MENYEDILFRMKENYKELTGFSADDVADIGIRLKVLASEIFSAQSYSNWLLAQVFPNTASGKFLDLHAQSRGLVRKEGTVAHGEVTFFTKLPAKTIIIIPGGTICSTSGENPLFFKTLFETRIPIGKTSVNTQVVSRESGRKYNVGAKAINTMVTPIALVDYIYNVKTFSYGSDIESDKDLQKRLNNSYVNTITGTNKAYYIYQALKVDGVNSATVVPKVRGTGTVNVYICGKGRECSDLEVKEVQNVLQKAREVNVDVLTIKAKLLNVSIKISIEVKPGYDKYDVKNKCIESLEEYFDNLEVGQPLEISQVYNAINKVEGVSYINLLEPLSRVSPNIDTKLWLNKIDVYFESE